MSNAASAIAPAKSIKDPQPSVDRIDDLAKRILTGDIYLPRFQREFVWERSQVIELLDSVARNYPSTFLRKHPRNIPPAGVD